MRTPLVAGDQRDAVLVVPRARVDHDLRDRLLAGEHRRKQDPVVVRVRLLAQHRDRVAVGRERAELLDRAHPAMPLPTTTRRDPR
jgi:hypothetical protein